MANRGRISVKHGWDRVVGRVATQGSEVDAKITVELDRNNFTRLEDFIERVGDMERAVANYIEITNQEVANMIEAARIMEERDQLASNSIASLAGSGIGTMAKGVIVGATATSVGGVARKTAGKAVATKN